MVPPRKVWPMAFDKAVKEDALVAAARQRCVCACFKGVTEIDRWWRRFRQCGTAVSRRKGVLSQTLNLRDRPWVIFGRS